MNFINNTEAGLQDQLLSRNQGEFHDATNEKVKDGQGKAQEYALSQN